MKRIALVCTALATLGLAACADYYGSDYGYGRTHYGYYGGGYYSGSCYGGYYSPGWYDRYGYFHPATCRRY
jgi:hypothetical protein